jgi:uncharacterized protein (TIGR00645 family)
MENALERALLATRWLLLPLFASLLLGVLAIYAIVFREVAHMAALLAAGPEIDILVSILNILDLVLIANLLVMIAVGSYESIISRFNVAQGADMPEWLGKLDSGNVKVKVAVALVLVSAIHLLQLYLRGAATERLLVFAAVHLAFVISAVMMAWADRLGRTAH